MVSAVGTRPNYYEVLGVTPSASDDEISQAFAKLMSMFRARPITAIAQLSAAFETLRNPAKRRAYDRSLGLAEEAVPRARAWALAAKDGGTAFFDLHAKPVAAPPSTPPTPPTAKAEPQPRLERPAEPRVASFIAASLREPVKEELPEAPPAPKPRLEPVRPPQLEADPQSQPDPVPPPPMKAEPKPEPRLEHIFATARASIPDGAAAVSIDWKRTGIVVGALVVGVGILGAWAGIAAGGDAADSQGVTVALPSAKIAPTAVPAADQSVAAPQAQFRRQIAATRTEPAASRQQPVAFESSALDQVQSETSVPQNGQSLDSAVEQAVATSAPAQAVPASMPLPNRVIARTIERIGYSCGEVASTNAIEGSSGAFNVTCTSGQSYRAAPVHGRYRFKRLGRN